LCPSFLSRFYLLFVVSSFYLFIYFEHLFFSTKTHAVDCECLTFESVVQQVDKLFAVL